MRAKLYGIRNFSVLCLHRTMPSILRNIFQSNVRIDGLLLPGHVCTITGSKPFEFLAHEFGITGVVSGFTPEDVIQSIDTVVGNLGRTPRIHIQYQRAVTLHGNIAAQKVTKQVFQPCDTSWRGFGLVKDSGLIIKQKWSFFDARNRFGLETVSKQNATKNTEKCCCCGDIMQGLLSPPECQLFKEYCRPDTPLGPCMVSHEGSCSIYYKYGG
jgi:hydrogenase expression/formation protein HypD